MSRAKRLQIPIGLAIVAAVYFFHTRYEIVPRQQGGWGDSSVGGQRAPRGGSPSAIRTTEKHVGAEDPDGVVFIPKQNEMKSLADGGGGDATEGQSSVGRRISPFLRGLGPGKSFWMFCAKQYHSCTCAGTIRWGRGGAGGKWKNYELASSSTQQTLECSVKNLPDILPGDDAKHCECEMKVGDSVYEAITNPGILPPEAGADASPLVTSSCSIIERSVN